MSSNFIHTLYKEISKGTVYFIIKFFLNSFNFFYSDYIVQKFLSLSNRIFSEVLVLFESFCSEKKVDSIKSVKNLPE